MFSTYFDSRKVRALLASTAVPTAGDVEELFARGPVPPSAAAMLLRGSDDPGIRRIVRREARDRRSRRRAGQLFLVPPLYISDGNPEKGGCRDGCGYCPWRNGNVPEDKLRRLSFDEIEAESRLLHDRGYRVIELVAATDELLFDGAYAAKTVAAAGAAGFSEIGVNYFPLGTPERFAMLREAGCTFLIIWQETYDPDVYAKAHGRGPKSKMPYRLDGQDRALQGGIPTVGLAFLGGLSDWRFEALSVIEHGAYLKQRYGANLIFGMPRWKGADAPPGLSLHPYDDDEYKYVGALYSILFEDDAPWFSTREPHEVSADAAAGGGCLFTVDCSTAVGGYTDKAAFPQFPVYSKDLAIGEPWLRSLGFDPRHELPWTASASERNAVVPHATM